MTRHAREPKFGPWTLSGVMMSGKADLAVFTRQMDYMTPDGLWHSTTEQRTRTIESAMYQAAIPLSDYQAMSAAFGALHDRLKELAAEHIPMPENDR